MFLDYIAQKEALFPFYSQYPSLESFQAQIELKANSYACRDVLVEVLNKQNAAYPLHDRQRENLAKLAETNCFTVTTGHQLALATGPLYFLYKILTTLKLSEKLKAAYPAHAFVPVFWMATEDHDFEEINHFHLFGKKYAWEKQAGGAVGNLTLEGLGEVLEKVPDFPSWLREAYMGSQNLAEATRKIVHHLFGPYGIVVLDGDDKDLKKCLQPVIARDLLEGKYAPLLRETTASLQGAGYKSQAFVRDQNFFFLAENERSRIEKKGEEYVLVNSGTCISKENLAQAIDTSPEVFSPNVVVRPLYQEMVLPNLAYIGGPGELAYWLQLKGVFDTEQVPIPLLFPRNFITLIGTNIKQKMEEAGLEVRHLFLEDAAYHQLLLEKLHVEQFDFSEEEKGLELVKQHLKDKAFKADKTLVQAAEAEMAKIAKSLGDFQKRLDKALENKHQLDIQKLQNIRKKLFPEGELQERHDNFLNFYINRPDFIQEIYEALDPFHFEMNCICL